MEKKLILIIGLSCCAVQNFANNNMETATNYKSLSNSEKIVVYSKNGILYRSEMYFGNSKEPNLVNEFTPGAIPKDAQKHVYHSINEFHNARATLDSNYKITQKKIAAKLSVNTADADEDTNIKLAYGFNPSVQEFLQGTGSTECYKSDPETKHNPETSHKMIGVDNAGDWGAVFSYEHDIRLLGIAEGALLFHNNMTLDATYKGTVSDGRYDFVGATAVAVNTGIPGTDNLTENGKNMLNQNRVAFLQSCGSAGVDAFIGGVVVIAEATLTTTSHELDVKLKKELKDDLDLNKLKMVINGQGNFKYTFSKIRLNFKSKGNVEFAQAQDGQTDFTSYIGKKMEENSGYLAQCEGSVPPNITACATYVDNMSSAISSALTYASGSLSRNQSASRPKGFAANTLYPFPNGIKMRGFTNPPIGNSSENRYVTYKDANDGSGGTPDPFKGITGDVLKNDVAIAHQLITLAARARLLAGIPEYRTKLETNFLNNLGNLFENDAKAIIKAGRTCYINTEELYSQWPDPTCNNAVKLANGELTVVMTNLPNNVFELYGGKDGNPAKDSVAELLFKNAIALQYEADYTEVATGITDSTDAPMVRAANQISFGVAYYNSKASEKEFFGGKDGSGNSGYIMVGMLPPELGYSNNTYRNGNLSANGVKWWQYYKGNKAVAKIEAYNASKLYFVLNNPQLLSTEALDTSNSTNVIFNKVIDDNVLSGDSSTTQNGGGVSIAPYSNYQVPSLANLINRAKLPAVMYHISGTATALANNKKAAGVSCINGVYLPGINHSKDPSHLRDKATYGSSIQTKYLCYRDTEQNAADKWTWFKLGNGGDAGRVKDLTQTTTLDFTPINGRFFGF